MASKVILLGFVIIFFSTWSDALRLLVFFPMHSKSHSILGHGVVSRLLEAGHEVVHVTSFPRDKPVANLTEITSGMEKWMKAQQENNDAFKLKNLIGKPNFGDSFMFINFVYDMHKIVLENPAVINFLSDPKQKFDAVILEWFFSPMIAGIAPLFHCPLIWFGSTEAHWQVLQLVDEIPNPSYNVDLFSASRPPLGCWERLHELYIMIKKMIIYAFYVTPLEKNIYNDIFPKLATSRGLNMPSYEEAIYNGSLLLLNSHPSIGTPFRLPQSAKYVAGYHIDNNVNALPKDLQKLMDESKHGVIYFSMGSNLRSIDMTDHMKTTLLNIFGKLKQTVIWKFEGDLDKVPVNVHLVKWAPQQGLLSHPNLKFFITHGGQLSTTEAIHFGVPVIGIPVLGDQHVNMRSVQSKGFGIGVTLAEDMANDLYSAIEEMLKNPSYKAKAKELSYIYHNRLESAGNELVFWVEHVVKTKGAPHLRSPAMTLPFYKRFYLDFVIISLLLLIILKYFIKKLISKVFKAKKSIKVKKH